MTNLFWIFVQIILLHNWLWNSISSSLSTWITYENNASYKWCRYLTTNGSGYAWNVSDSSPECGGNSSYRWSTDLNFLPRNSKMLLWPTDYSNWNSWIN